jgi:hypothetical protein
MSVDVSGGTTGLTTSGGPVTDSGTITLGGTLAVANGGTGVTTSTGTGSVVLSNNPTLDTPILGAASATSIANALGAVSAPSYTFAGDTNTGMWSPAADTIAFSEGGVEAMRIDSSGNVGIGTSSPGARLQINSQDGFRFDVEAGAASTMRFGSAFAGESTGALAWVRSAGAMTFSSGATGSALTERMRIDPSGNIGIGTTSPGQRLTVAGVIESTTGGVRFPDGTTQTTAASGGPTLSAIASGSLSDGSTVVVNADGTVSVVAGATQAIGTAVVFESATTTFVSATYDSAAQRVVIAYRDFPNSQFGTAIVGTVSGTSISFGTPVVFESAITTNISATYDSNAQRVVIAYTDGGNSLHGTAIVGAVSGTSISFGTAVVFESASTASISATYDANAQRVVIAYQDSGNSGFGTAIVGTVSGTSISFGTAFVFESASTSFISATYDVNAQRVVIAYQDFGNSNFGTTVVGTVSGTSISFGTPVVFESASSQDISATYDSAAQRVFIAYRDNGNSSFGTAIVGTVSGTSISFGAAVVFNSANSLAISATYDSNAQRVVIAYRDNGNSDFGTAVVFRNAFTNITSENFIGFSNAAYTNGQTATIQISGTVDDAQSGLVPGQSYFVQNNGTLGLSPASPSVFAGTAVAANRIIVKG